MDKKYAEYLLEETKKNYNLTAESYTRTRAFIPEDIKSLAEYVKEKEKVLDSGCASGRLFGVLKNKNIDYFGVDISERLIDIAKKTYPEANFHLTGPAYSVRVTVKNSSGNNAIPQKVYWDKGADVYS